MMPPKGKSTKNAAKGRGRGRKPRGLGEGTLKLVYICIYNLGPFLGDQILNFDIFVFFFFRKIYIWGV